MLLIHSLSEFRELIEGSLEVVAPKHVVEIGAEGGVTSELLATWAKAHGATVTTIDPSPAGKVRELAAGAPDVVTLLEARSPAALEDVAAAELYLIDGDHNYYTVSGELARVRASCAAVDVLPVVLAHDVGWPCARRDQYYDPKSLPPEALNQPSYDVSLHVDAADPVEVGFSGGGFFAIARLSGGPKNGVLTAVEDFLASTPGWELHVVPAVFGLGILFPSAHPRAEALREMLRPYAGNPLLARLELNRLRNWLEVRRFQELETVLVARRDALEAELVAARATLAEREATSAAQIAELEARAAELEARAARIAELEARAAGLDAEKSDALRKMGDLEARWYTRAGRWLEKSRRS